MNEFDLAGYMIFAFVTSITPGPNNLLLLACGKQSGIKGSLRLMLGIFIGFSTLLYISGYGITAIITINHTVEIIFKIISSIWLFYLAIIMSKINTTGSNDSKHKIGIIPGFFMQFVNPKAWIMAIGGASAFLPHFHNIHWNVFVFTFTFGIAGIPCMISWVLFGDLFSKIIKSEKSNRILGYVLFLLMISCIIMIWI